MTDAYIFDVDGTLTPSRGVIDPEFKEWFTNFCITHDVYLVTGSDYQKTREQLGDYLLRWPIFVYNCSGSEVWAKGQNLKTKHWKLPNNVEQFLQDKLDSSEFGIKTGHHFDIRSSSVNFSILGRNATPEQRAIYRTWDIATNERNDIVTEFRKKFTDLEISAGGETGVDIYPLGCNKSQIISDFDLDTTLHFFGDRMDEHGNDKPLADVISERGGNTYAVTGWQETWQILKSLVDK